jgi:hypothetical protein
VLARRFALRAEISVSGYKVLTMLSPTAATAVQQAERILALLRDEVPECALDKAPNFFADVEASVRHVANTISLDRGSTPGKRVVHARASEKPLTNLRMPPSGPKFPETTPPGEP